MHVGQAWRSLPGLIGGFWLLLIGCASAPAAQVRSSEGPGVGHREPESASEAPAQASRPVSGPTLPLPGGEEPTPDKALPELRIEAIGMHVGGGKNDAAEKAPFQRALERQFPAMLECYRLSEAPPGGGSFGIDLKIPRTGGRATPSQPRTRLRGAAFQECMVQALSGAVFERPGAGPTVVSYSVRFTLGH